MLRYGLRRVYLALIGLLLLTLPLFALMRPPMQHVNICVLRGGDYCPRDLRMALHRNGPLYEFWQTGMPPNDYWPLALALLAAEGGVQLVLSRRQAATN